MQTPFNRTILLGLLSAALFGGCRGNNSFNSRTSPVKTGTPNTGGKIIPPTPVIGSFFTSNGAPIENARITLLKSGYSTTSNAQGEFSVPVGMITSTSMVVKIDRPLSGETLNTKDTAQIIYSNILLPADFIKAVNDSRVLQGETPLSGNIPTADGSAVDTNSQTQYLAKRKLGLQLPENRMAPSTSSDPSANSNLQQTVPQASLPVPNAQQTKAVSMWTKVHNESVDSAARFRWENSFGEDAAVRIVFSKSEMALSSWDGRIETVPAWPNGTSAENLVVDASKCSDLSYAPSSTGALTASGGNRCGFLRSQFPFSEGEDVFIRVVGETNSEIKLSPVYRIKAGSKAPTLVAPSNQSIRINLAVPNLATQIADVDSQLSCGIALMVTSDNPTLLPEKNIIIGGTAPNCLLSIYPSTGQTGTSTIGVVASDGGLTASGSFTLTVTNDVPVLSAIAAQSTAEDIPSGVIAFSITDPDGPIQACNGTFLSYTSATPTVVASTGAVAWGGIWPNCTAVVTPVANGNGMPLLTFTASDGRNTSAGQSFVLTVTAVNDAPTLNPIAAQTTAENIAKAVAFTVGDVDGNLTCSATNLSYSSAVPTLVAATNAVAWSGTWPNCTGTITPVANANGNVAMTFTVNDGTLSASQTFNLTVTSVNSLPIIAAIAAQSTVEDTPTAPVTVTITDIDGPAQTCNGTFLSYTSGSPAVVASAGAIAWGGTWPNCTAVITPALNASGTSNISFVATDGTSPSAAQSFTLTVTAANDAPTMNPIAAQTTPESTPRAVPFTVGDVDGNLTCNATRLSYSSAVPTLVAATNAVVWSGNWPNCTGTITPVANANGNVDITFTISDGTLTASQTFNLTVTVVNTAPTIAAIPDPQTTAESTPLDVALTLGDADGALSCTTANLSYSSTSTSLVAATGAVQWTGTWPNCSARITPIANANGNTTITIIVSDGLLTASSSFVLAVTAVNVAPTISAISPQTTAENTPVTVSFTADDLDGALSCSAVYLNYTSSVASVVATTGAVAWNGTWPNCMATITPVANASGLTNLAFTVSDGLLSASQSFNLTVTPVNDPPTISNIPDQVTDEDLPINGIPFTIADTDSTVSCASSLTVSSTDNVLFPDGSITRGGTGTNCTLNVTPAATKFGSATVTVAVNDGNGGTAQTSFLVVVNSMPDLLYMALIAPQVTSEDIAIDVPATIQNSTTTFTCSSTNFIYSSTNPAVVANSGAVAWKGTWPNCLGTVTPILNASGSADITFAFVDGVPVASRTFTLTVTTVNDPPAISNIQIQDIYTNSQSYTFTFQMSDSDTALTCASAVTVTSNNPTLLPAGSISFSGTPPDCVGTVTPAVGVNGTANVTISASDGTSTTPATFTMTVRPGGWTQEAYVKASNSQSNDNFGGAVALSGNLLAVAALGEDENQITITPTTPAVANNGLTDSGAVYIYSRAGTTWAPEAYVKAANADASDRFGSAVTLSGDTLAVGASQEASKQSSITNGPTASDDDSVNYAGAVYVYKRNGTTWVQEAYIKPSNLNGDNRFGSSVSLTGNTLVVGSPYEDSSQNFITQGNTAAVDNNSMNSGASYLFTRIGANWKQTAHFKAVNNWFNGLYGGTVSISGDTIALGAHSEDACQNTITNGTTAGNTQWCNNTYFIDTGAVYVYRNNGEIWKQEAYIKTTNIGSNDYFGSHISLHSDTLVASAPSEDSNQTTVTNGGSASADNSVADSGAVYVYRRTGTSWAQEAYIKASNAGAWDYFGGRVALAGNTLIVSATAEDSSQSFISHGSASSADNSKTNSGAVYVYLRTGNTWNQDAFIKAGNVNSDDAFGSALALSGDTLAVGSPFEDSNQILITNGTGTAADTSAPKAGAVYIYTNKSRLFDPDVRLSSRTKDTITLEWSDNLGQVAQVKVAALATATGSPAEHCTSADAVALQPATVTRTFSSLTASTKYSFRICAWDGVNASRGTLLWAETTSSTPPTLAALPETQTMNEDGVLIIPLTVGDTDGPLSCTDKHLSFSSSNPTLMNSAQSVLFGGVWPNCTAQLTPSKDFSGTASLDVTLTDGYFSSTKSFTLTVNAVNDSPTITGIVDQFTVPNVPVQLIPFQISDKDSNLSCNNSSLTATSNNSTLIPVSNISFSGTIPNCFVSLNPAANQDGRSTISVIVSDGMLTAKSNFDFIVGQGWNQVAYIKASNSQTSDAFASSVSLSGDLLAVGAKNEDSNQNTITTVASSNDLLTESGAVYVFRRVSDSIWEQESYIKAANVDSSDYFGVSASLSGDTLAVGASHENTNQNTITNGSVIASNESLSDSGAVYIYRRSGTAWAQEAFLKPSNAGSSDYFGLSLSLSGDVLAVAATGEDSSQTAVTVGTTAGNDNSKSNSGAVYIFRRTGINWAQEAYIKAANSDAEDAFGNAVSIVGDSLAVGVPEEDSSQPVTTIGTAASLENNATGSGAVYIFRKSGMFWLPEAYAKAVNTRSGSKFGKSVALSGNLLAVGAPNEDSSSSVILNGIGGAFDASSADTGAVYVYKRNSLWTQEAYIKASNPTSYDLFGGSVSLSGDTLAVGSIGEDSSQRTVTNGTKGSLDESLSDSGAVYLIKRTAGLWNYEAYVKARNPDSLDEFGQSVSLSGDSLAVGTMKEASNDSTITNGSDASTNNTAYQSGAVYIFRTKSRSFRPEIRITNRTSSTVTFEWNTNLGLSPALYVSAATPVTSQPECTANSTSLTSMNSHTATGLNAGSKYGFKFCNIAGNDPDGTTLWAETLSSTAPVFTSANITPQITSEDTSITVAFTASDPDGNLSCSESSLIYFTSAPAIVAPYGAVTWGGSWPSCTATIQPNQNSFGTAQITFLLSDGTFASQQTFTLTVTEVNDSPIISSLGDLRTPMGTPLVGVPFSISDTETTLSCADSVSILSSNTELFPAGASSFSGAAPQCTLTLTPAPGQSGSSTVTLTVNDTVNTSSVSFNVTVFAQNAGGWLQEAYIKADNATSSDFFGFSVSVSGDSLAVGAPNEDSMTNTITNGGASSTDNTYIDVGAIYLYGRTGSLWSPQAYIKPSNNTFPDRRRNTPDAFGNVVRLIGDLLAVGAPYEDNSQRGITNGTTSSNDDAAADSGAVFLYRRDVNKIWAQEAYIKASNADPSDLFGNKVAATSDTVAVVAPGEDSLQLVIINSEESMENNAAASSGAIYVYRRVGAAWTQEAFIKPGKVLSADSASLDIDGDTLTVGYPHDTSSLTAITNGPVTPNDCCQWSSGSVFVYRRDTQQNWTQEAFLKGSNTRSYDYFGASLNISGNTLAVGAIGQDSGEITITNGAQAPLDQNKYDPGAVYVFRRTGEKWAQEAFLKAFNSESQDNFGSALSLHGNTLAVSASGEDGSLGDIVNGIASTGDNLYRDSGAVYVYRRYGPMWSQEAYLKAANQDSRDRFGTHVSLAGDTVAIGSPNEDSAQYTITNGLEASANNALYDSGAVYVYRHSNRMFEPAVRVTTRTNNSISFQWDSNFGNATHVLVANATSDFSSPPLNCTNPAATLALANTKSYTYSGLTSGKKYGFRFCSQNATQVSEGNLIWVDTLSGGAPSISAIANQTTLEDQPATVSFTLSDPDGALSCSSANLNYTSSAPQIVASNNAVVWAGTWPNCSATVTPVLNATGSVFLTFSVSDGTSVASTQFSLTTAPVNDAPQMVTIGNLFTTPNTPLVGIPLQVEDAETTLNCSAIQVTTNNTTLLPVANVILAGSFPACTMTLSPAANQSGVVDISLSLSDGSSSVKRSLTLTVGEGWTQESYLKPSNNAIVGNLGMAFGTDVSVFGDTVAVGAPFDNYNLNTITNSNAALNPPAGQCTTYDARYLDMQPTSCRYGGVLVYRRSNSTWVQEAYIKASNNGLGFEYGNSLSLNGDTLSVGGPGEASSANTITNGTTSSTGGGYSGSGAVFVYSRIGTSWSQEAYFKASNRDYSESFGKAVSVSGNTLAVGSPNENSTLNVITNGPFASLRKAWYSLGWNSGGVYIFRRNGVVWNQEAFLKQGNSSSYNRFGSEVSLSGDTLVVGSPTESSNQSFISNNGTSSSNTSLTNSGAVFVYRRTGTLWSQEAYIKAVNANSDDQLGASVAVSGDTIAAGATGEDSSMTTIINGITAGDDNNASSSGAVYIYRRNGTEWAQDAYIKPGNGMKSWGYASSLGLSGNTLAVGVEKDSSSQRSVIHGSAVSLDNTLASSGGVYVYRRNTNAWAQDAYLKVANGDKSDGLSRGLSISGDTIAVGAPFEDSNQITITNGTGSSLDNSYPDSGAAYIFRNKYRMFEPDVRIVSQTSSSITFAWTLNGGTATQVKVAPAVLGSSSPTVGCTDAGTTTVSTTEKSYTVTGLAFNKKYGFRFCAFDGTNTSDGATQWAETFNNGPNIATIANQQTNEDTPLTGINLTISDTDGPAGVCNGNFLSYFSHDPASVAEFNAVTWGGTWPNCSATITPLPDVGGRTFKFSFMAHDGTVMGAPATFDLTLIAVNDAPILVGPLASAYMTKESTPLTLSFQGKDIDSSMTCTSTNWSYSSSNVFVVAATGAVTWSGTWPNCSATLTPIASAFGNTDITFRLSDGKLMDSRTFTLLVFPENNAPTIADVPDSKTRPGTQISVNVQIRDLDGNLPCNTSLTANSSNTTLLPSTGIIVTGTYPDCIVRLTPSGDQQGTTTITLTVNDGYASALDTFVLTVSPNINVAPTIATIPAQTTPEDTTLSNVLVKITDDNSLICTTAVTFSSNNPLLLPTGNITVGGTFPNCTLTLIPAAQQFGSASISVSVSDGEFNPTSTFGFTVTSVNDAPTISLIENQTLTKNTPLDVPFSIADIDTTLSCANNVIAAPPPATLIQSVNILGTAPNCLARITPVSNATGGPVTLQLTVTDGGLSAVRTFQATVVAANWASRGSVSASNATSSYLYGTSVALSGDTLAVGSPGESSADTVITNGTSSSTNSSSSASGAVYVYRSSSSAWTQEAFIKASNADAGDQFGIAAGLSGDTLAVGAWNESSNQSTISNSALASSDNTVTNSGAIYIFGRTGSTWSQRAYIKAGNREIDDRFGEVLALSNDRLAVGVSAESSNQATITNGPSSSADNSILSSGAVYIYRLYLGGWAQEAYIKASNVDVNDRFGSAVDLDGDTLVVGASFEDSKLGQNASAITTTASTNNQSADSGAAYVFRRNGIIWTLEAFIKADKGSAGDLFGQAVSLSGDTLSVGATNEDSDLVITTSTPPQNNERTKESGAIYVYKRTASTWAFQGYLKTDNSNAGDNVGRVLDLKGNTLLAGVPLEDANLFGANTVSITGSADNSSPDNGAVYVFRRNGSVWSQEAYVKSSSSASGDNFGQSVALSGDTLAAAAPLAQNATGKVFLYRNQSRSFDPDVRVSERTATSITFVWNANLGTAKTIKVAPAAAGTGTPTATCSQAGSVTLAIGTTTYKYSGLTANTKYGFRFCGWDETTATEGTTLWETTTP